MDDTNNLKKNLNYRIVTDEELKADDDDLDGYSLKKSIKIKDKTIKTFGDLRPYIRSTKIARKFEDFLHEDDFDYFYNWILLKEIKLKNLK
jgi:hypothetical protein